MTTTSTITEISNSSDALWEAVCAYEDGNGAEANDILATLSDADRAIFTEEATRIDRKFSRANEYKEPTPFTFRPFSEPRGFDYEDAILARQERDLFPV